MASVFERGHVHPNGRSIELQVGLISGRLSSIALGPALCKESERWRDKLREAISSCENIPESRSVSPFEGTCSTNSGCRIR